MTPRIDSLTLPEPAGASLAAPLARLHRACFPDDPWDATAIAQILALPGCFGAIAWHGDDDLAGFVLAQDLGGECEILSLGVAPTRRRHGTGRALLGATLAAARRRHAASAVLEVATDNTAALALYLGLGFVAVGRRPGYYRRRDGHADAMILRQFFAAIPS